MIKHASLWFGLLVGCSGQSTEPPLPRADKISVVSEPTAPAPAPSLAVVFERLLGGSSGRPLFGPGGSITVGESQWRRDGTFGSQARAIDGQIRPIAVIGSADHPTVIALGWGGMDDMPAVTSVQGEFSWLLTADAKAVKPATATAISHDFLDEGLEVSPNREALAAIEGDSVVVRSLPAGVQLARASIGEPIDREGKTIACWVDDARVAWTATDAGAAVLRTLTVRDGSISSVKITTATSELSCDPSGGAAAVAAPAGAITLLDLTTGAILVSTAVENNAEVSVAVGGHGRRLAIATDRTLTVYQRDGNRLTSLFSRTTSAGSLVPEHRSVELAFSPDGARLAVVASTLVVLGPADEARGGPPVPQITFALPPGFVAIAPNAPEQDAWRYAQLPAPSGFARLPALLVNAISRDAPIADVTALAIDRAELASVPGPDATDAQITAFAKLAMPRLFGAWRNAEIGTERDAPFTLRVGRTDGMPWFETRELWRDGCEWYDGYTRVVVDREVVFVVRALAAPTSSTAGWLARFLDLPFGVRTKTARRPGPDSGPC